jgi:hypothetical protein
MIIDRLDSAPAGLTRQFRVQGLDRSAANDGEEDFANVFRLENAVAN